MKKICVLGSANIDLVSKVERFPLPGESIEGAQFNTFTGGKGANQAAAAGKLGAEVSFLGMVGNDAFGDMAINALKKANADTSKIIKANTGTGIAVITVNGAGENMLVYIPGANALVDVEYVKENISAIDEAEILMLQLEIPMKTVVWAAEYAKKRNKTVILDPAPAAVLPDELLSCCSYITPNETEMQLISGLEIKDGKDLRAAADAMIRRGADAVINKCGGKGAYILTKEETLLVPGYKVDVVDTTAAGDSFNAGLAVSLARGKNLEGSVRFANAVGAISVTKMGAQSSMPSEDEVSAFLKNNI